MDYPKFTTGDFTWTNAEKTEAAFVENPNGKIRLRYSGGFGAGIDPYGTSTITIASINGPTITPTASDEHPNNEAGY